MIAVVLHHGKSSNPESQWRENLVDGSMGEGYPDPQG
jgi:hypothetical protein